MSNVNLESNIYLIFNKIIKGAAFGLVLKVATTALNFLIAVMLARLLEPAGYGQYVLAMTIITLLSIPVTLGLPNLIVRYIAAYKAREQWALLKGLIFFSNYVVLFLVLVVSVSGYFLSRYYELLFKANGREIFIYALILLPILSLTNIHSAILRGFNFIVLGQISGTLVKSMLLFTCVLLFFIFEYTHDPATIMIANVGCALAAFALGAYLMVSKIPIEAQSIVSQFEIKIWLQSALPLLLMGGLLTMNQQTDLLMIGYFMKTSDVGIYQVSIRLSELMTFLLVAGNTAFGPTISTLYTQNRIKELQHTVTKFVKIITYASLPIAIILSLFGGQLIGLLFGHKYIDAYYPLIILLFGQCVNVLIGPAGTLLIMTGFEKLAARGLFVSLMANIVLNIILIPDFGILGAAIATSSSLIIWNIMLYKYSTKATGIDCFLFTTIK